MTGKIQQVVENMPPPAHWIAIIGSLALSVLQPLAALAALVLAGLQIYLLVKKHWFSGPRDRRKKERQ